MLSDKSTVCPVNLLNIAHQKRGVNAAIVNAGKKLPMMSVMDAVSEKLITPILIGDKQKINECAEELKFDISDYEIIHEPIENNTASIATKLASEDKVKIIVKGHIHTDVLMKEVLKREYKLIGKTRLSHIWHMTLQKDDRPLIITDGALNVSPNLKTKMNILRNVIDFSHRINISRPKISILSATEEVIESVQSSVEAKELTELAKKEKNMNIIERQNDAAQQKFLKAKGNGSNNIIVVPQNQQSNNMGGGNNTPSTAGGNEISFVPFEPLNIGDDILLHKLNQ